MRINKYVASAGIASRRKAEELILDGKIKINGRVVKDLSIDIRKSDIVLFGDKKIETKLNHIYLVLHKPKGYICSNSDDKGRKTIMDLIEERYSKERLFAVGRLDYDSEGLLLLTTDGDMANRLMHPRFEIPKVYVVKVEGELSQDEIKQLSNGVMLDGTLTKKCKVKVLSVDRVGANDIDGTAIYNMPMHTCKVMQSKYSPKHQSNNKSGNKLKTRNKDSTKQHISQHIEIKDGSHHKPKIISRIEVVLSEGRNRQVRRMFETINRQVVFLKRTAIGDIKLGGLTRGKHRELRDPELQFLSKL